MSDEVASPKISVVVPIYKVEKYLRDCVESVLAQTFTDFELILVDDGSPDRCGEICDELAKQDSRIRVFHQANGGVSSARRLGVEQARGEWINFVDPDDLLPKNSLKDLIAETTGDVEWVQGMRQLFNDGETPKAETLTGTVKTFDLAGLVENMLLCHPGPCEKLVRRKLFTPHVMAVPREIRFSQDTQMNIRILANKPRKGKEIDKVVYFYRKGVATATTSLCVRTEAYVFRFIKLLLAEMRKISTPSNKERLSFVLSRHLCGIVARELVGYGLPIKFPHRLLALMRPAARSRPRFLFVYLCLKFNCLGIAHFAAKIFGLLKGKKFDVKKMILLE